VIADFYEQLGIAGEPKVGAEPKRDEPDAFTAGYTVAGFFPADYATGDESRDLLEDDLAGVGGESDHVLLVVSGSGFAHGGGEFAGGVVHARDYACRRGAIDMHVPDGEEDGDALAGAAGVFFVGCHDDAAAAGETMAPASAGMTRSGSRKK